MALKTDIRGMIWRYPDYFIVGREQLRQFAQAIKCDHPAYFEEDAAAELGYDAIVAPMTFVTILAKLVQLDFFRNVDIGMETMQIVQVDQRFVFYKPVLAGISCGPAWTSTPWTSVSAPTSSSRRTPATTTTASWCWRPTPR
ncbi:metal-binding domain of MaoC dehydratase family protein [Mycobacterium kansasii 824]|nr:metal-binding domain of MaoC dehydratase family protein [Mycobacterium kansasii 824]